MVGVTDCRCGERHHPNAECPNRSAYLELASLFLQSSGEVVNRALEAAESDIRFKDKVGNTLYFLVGEREFWITEQELLAPERPVLEILQERAAR